LQVKTTSDSSGIVERTLLLARPKRPFSFNDRCGAPFADNFYSGIGWNKKTAEAAIVTGNAVKKQLPV